MQGKPAQGEPERKGYEKKLEDWKLEGFDVSRLAGILRSSPQEAAGAFETAEKGISRNREIRREWEELALPDAGEAGARMQKLLGDPWMSAEAENLLLELQVQNEKRKKEEQRRERDRERRLARFRERTLAWKAQGYDTGALEAAIEKDPDSAEGELALFEESVARLKASEEELRAMGDAGTAEERQKIHEMLHDPARAQEAEDAIIHLRIRDEKARKAAAARAEQEKRDRGKLHEKVQAWRDAGLKVPLPDDIIDNAPMDELNDRVEELEEQVVRLQELRDELGRLELSGLEAEKTELEDMLRDLAQVQAAEERLLRLGLQAQRAQREKERKAEESRRWRHELSVRFADLKGAGYDTARLEAASARDDESLKTEWLKYRILLKRSQELESEARAISPEGFEAEIGQIVQLLRRVTNESNEEALDWVKAIYSKQAARREEELRAREAEKKEKEELTQRLMKWVGEGYRDGSGGELERVVSYGLPRMREEVASLGARIERAEGLRRQIMSLDISGFETESATVLEELYDLSRLPEIEPRIDALGQRIAAKRDEERRRSEEDGRRRSEFRSKVAGWRKLGFDVTALEGHIDGDMEFLRKEYALFRMRVQKAQTLLGELATLPPDDAGPELEEVRRELYSLERLDECAGRIERLRVGSGERARQRKRLGELLKKVEELKGQGYDVSRLESLPRDDVEALTREFMMLKIRVQKLRELDEELRLLDTAGFESERAAIESELHNVDAVDSIRARLSELEGAIARRLAAEVRQKEERRRRQGEFMSRMAAWLEEGYYVDTLEGALGKEPDEMAAEFKRFGETVDELRRTKEWLEELSGSGQDELIGRIRDKLRDPARIDETRRDMNELRERLEHTTKEAEGRRKEEDELRFNIVKQIEAWEAMGYDVSALEKLAGGRLEDLRRGMISFRMRMERMQGLAGILQALDTRGFESDVAAVRALMKDIDRAEEVETAVSALKEKVHGRKEADRTSKEKMHRLRDACTDRFLAMLAQGYNVDTLDGVLELPYEELSMECERLEGVVKRLKEIETEAGERGLADGNPAMAARLRDVNALAVLEEWLVAGNPPDAARPPPDKIHIFRYGTAAPSREEAAHAAAPAARTEAAPQALRKEEPPAGRPHAPEAHARPAQPQRAAPALAAAVAMGAPGPAAGPDGGTSLPPKPPGGTPTCDGCGEPVEAGWKRCPSCMRPLVPAGEPAPAAAVAPATAPPAPARPPAPGPEHHYDRIAARPERDMGIRDAAAAERREKGHRDAPLRPEKLEALRGLIAREKAKGVDVGDIEDYLESGVVTKEGLAIRLEAINEQSKRLDGPAGAATGPDRQAPAGAPAPAGPAPPAEAEAPGEPEPDERPEGAPAAEPAQADGQAGEGVKKLKKVKKVMK